MRTVTLFGSVYPLRGLLCLVFNTVFFFSLSGGSTSRDTDSLEIELIESVDNLLSFSVTS